MLAFVNTGTANKASLQCVNAVESTDRLKTHQTRKRGDIDRAGLPEKPWGPLSQVLQMTKPRIFGKGTFVVDPSAWGNCLHVVFELTSRSYLDRPLICGEAG